MDASRRENAASLVCISDMVLDSAVGYAKSYSGEVWQDVFLVDVRSCAFLIFAVLFHNLFLCCHFLRFFMSSAF